MTPLIDPYATQAAKQKRTVVAAVAATVALLFLGVGIGVLAAQKGPEPVVLVKSQEVAPPVLQAKAEPPPPVLPVDTGMPKEILDWLEHLRKTDDSRVNLTKTQLGSMMAKLVLSSVTSGLKPEEMFGEDGPNVEKQPTNEVSQEFKKLSAECKSLTDHFNSYPPPPECAAIAGEYQQTLSETEQMPLELAAALDSFGTDPSNSQNKIVGSMGTSSRRIDQATQRADALVQGICDKYKTRKWFSLQYDVGSGLGQVIQGYNPLPSK